MMQEVLDRVLTEEQLARVRLIEPSDDELVLTDLEGNWLAIWSSKGATIPEIQKEAQKQYDKIKGEMGR